MYDVHRDKSCEPRVKVPPDTRIRASFQQPEMESLLLTWVSPWKYRYGIVAIASWMQDISGFIADNASPVEYPYGSPILLTLIYKSSGLDIFWLRMVEVIRYVQFLS